MQGGHREIDSKVKKIIENITKESDVDLNRFKKTKGLYIDFAIKLYRKDVPRSKEGNDGLNEKRIHLNR